MINQFGPRTFRVCGCFGDITESSRRSIQAGCGKSLSLCRAYTHGGADGIRKVQLDQPVVAGEFVDLHGEPQGRWVKQHVDDITLIIWSTDQTQLRLALSSEEIVLNWLDTMEDPKVIVSDKTNIIPDCHAAEIVQQALRERNLEVGIAGYWVDLGVDTSAGNKRVEKRLNEIGNDTWRRAKHCGFTVSKTKLKEAKVLATGGVLPASSYGATSTGTTPKIIRNHKTMLNMALGGARRKGASATVNI